MGARAELEAWERGEKQSPEKAVLLTFDDGWESVYTDAYPVLKEFGFPFTMYLYKKYVNSGGRSMTWDQIREMMAFGAEVGSQRANGCDNDRPRIVHARVESDLGGSALDGC